MIFGEQSIQFKDPHHKTKHQLMDQIAKRAERLRTEALQARIGNTYSIVLPREMTVLEGTWQTLRLAIPPVDPESQTAQSWGKRCSALAAVAEKYQAQFGKTAFSVLQAASEWAREDARTSPIQRNSYERRCGQMLDSLTTRQAWPERENNATEQIERLIDWSRTANWGCPVRC